MDPEEVKKILGNAEISVEDKVKLLAGLHDAAARGITQKRDELLGQEKKPYANHENLPTFLRKTPV